MVREIFELALEGNGISKIRKHINKQHILRPAAYAAEQGAAGYERYFEGNEENRYIWSENSVRGILRSPIYAGNLAGYKRIAANMKSRKRPSKLPEEWEVIPDTHEGIVTQEECIELSAKNDRLRIIEEGERFSSRYYRNKRLGEFLKELDLSEGKSTGIPTIQEELRNNGSPKARLLPCRL